MVKVKVEGVRELQRKFNELAMCLDANYSEPVVLKATGKVTSAARTKAAYDTKRTKGTHLRDALVTRTLSRYGGKNPAPAISAVDRKLAPHAHLVEYGTVNMAAQPFHRPAWKETKREVLSDIIRGFRNLILRGEGLRR